MAAIRHLGFVTSSYRTTHEVLWLRHIGLSNFILIQFSVLKIWRFEFFCRFGLKCLFTPQNFGFWGSEPQNVIGHHRDPQKGAFLAATALTCEFLYRSVHWCDLCARQKNKKRKITGKERNLQWQTGCSPRPSTLTQWYVALHRGVVPLRHLRHVPPRQYCDCS